MNRKARRAASAKRAPAGSQQAIAKTLRDGVGHHQAGRLQQAERCYQSVLQQHSVSPDDQGHTDALHLLGLIQLQRRQLDTAVDLISRAVARNPTHPTYLSNLGIAHLERGEVEEALQRLREALEIDPGYIDARYNLGNALRKSGAVEDALEQFLFVAKRHPADAHSRNNAAICLIELERWERAIEHLMAALRADPSFAEAHANLAMVQFSLGRFEEAERCAREALKLAPDHAAALVCLGNILYTRREIEPSAACFDRAAKSDPTYGAAFKNLGNALSELYRNEEALTAYRRATELGPDPADALSGQARVLKTLGRLNEAIISYDQALSHDSDHLDARFGRAVTRLSQGKFEEGWSDYRRRESMAGAPNSFSREKVPTDLSGKRCLVERDQGLGDELFFLRFVGALQSRGARVSYRPDPRLADMLRRADVADEIVADDNREEGWDLRIAAGDLPHILGSGSDVPPSISLEPQPDRARETARSLDTFGPPPYIGVTWWAGTRGANRNLFKNAPLSRFAEAMRGLPGTIVALQRSPETGEIDQLNSGLGRPVLDKTAANEDLEEMLALIGLLDEYIAVSNTYVHLRAAVDRHSRVLVPNPPEFRWMAHGSESVWFPGTQVYRQNVSGDWSQAFSQLRIDLVESRVTE